MAEATAILEAPTIAPLVDSSVPAAIPPVEGGDHSPTGNAENTPAGELPQTAESFGSSSELEIKKKYFGDPANLAEFASNTNTPSGASDGGEKHDTNPQGTQEEKPILKAISPEEGQEASLEVNRMLALFIHMFGQQYPGQRPSHAQIAEVKRGLMQQEAARQERGAEAIRNATEAPSAIVEPSSVEPQKKGNGEQQQKELNEATEFFGQSFLNYEALEAYRTQQLLEVITRANTAMAQGGTEVRLPEEQDIAQPVAEVVVPEEETRIRQNSPEVVANPEPDTTIPELSNIFYDDEVDNPLAAVAPQEQPELVEDGTTLQENFIKGSKLLGRERVKGQYASVLKEVKEIQGKIDRGERLNPREAIAYKRFQQITIAELDYQNRATSREKFSKSEVKRLRNNILEKYTILTQLEDQPTENVAAHTLVDQIDLQLQKQMDDMEGRLHPTQLAHLEENRNKLMALLLDKKKTNVMLLIQLLLGLGISITMDQSGL